MVTGSDWIAHGLVLAGHALAKGISRYSQKEKHKIRL